MTELSVYSVAGYFSIVFFIFSSFFAYKIYKFNKGSKLWLSVYVGLIALVFYGFLNFSGEIGILRGLDLSVLKSLTSILLLLGSAMLMWGFWSMGKSFENFQVLGERAREKFASFETGKDRKKKK